MSSGVPQLKAVFWDLFCSLFLYLIWRDVFDCSILIKYADHTVIAINITDNFSDPSNCLDLVYKSCKDNTLLLNVSKSNELIISKILVFGCYY